MQSSELIVEGLNLMIFGMGFVFTFLTLLIFITKAMSKAVLRWFPVPEPSMPKPMPVTMGSVATPMTVNDPKLIAVLTAAIQRYRQDKTA